MRPNPTCPVCDHGATDAASIRVHNLRVATDGERVYPFGRGVQLKVTSATLNGWPIVPLPSMPEDAMILHAKAGGTCTVMWSERPATWLNREFGAFAPALLGRVPEGER